MKLYPPIIDGIIPAFYGTVLTVPFSMNRAVGNSDYTGFSAKMKTINGDLVGIFNTSASSLNKVSFTIPNNILSKLNVGQVYKIQLAYKQNETTGYYSTVGIVKYTSQPIVKIENLDSTEINNHQYSYVCSYQNEDSTEKMSSVEFILYKNNEIELRSGQLLHSVSDDDIPTMQTQSYEFDYIFVDSAGYSIKAIVTTVNQLEVSSPHYRLYDANNIDSEIENTIFTSELDYDSGCINLKLVPKVGKDFNITGAFLISRKGSDTNIWEEFKRIELLGDSVNSIELIDDTVIHGVTYEYSIQQYNSHGVYSKRKTTEKATTAYFENTFLIDADGRKLKIRFNPKMSTFKKDLLETKMDTIGSKYPYILKNGNVEYKEFQLSGLISYLMDDIYSFYRVKELDETRYTTQSDNNSFLESIKSKKEYGEQISSSTQAEYNRRLNIQDFSSTDLTDYNIAKEKDFKLQVLDWLTNGEPKLLKSPTEGNYIVRLMNVSFSPNDTLGRMLHTFTCTAYEIADYKKSTLEEYGFMTLGKESEKVIIGSINLFEIRDSILEQKDEFIALNKNVVTSFTIEDVMPGTAFEIDGQKIIINSTGSYSAVGEFSEIKIEKKYFLKDNPVGNLVYTYNTYDVQGFGKILKQSLRDNIGVELKSQFSTKKEASVLNDIRKEIVKWYYIRCEQKQLIDIYVKPISGDTSFSFGNRDKFNYYLDPECKEEDKIKLSSISDSSKYILYRVRYGKLDDLQRTDYDREYYNAIVKSVENGSVVLQSNSYKIIDGRNSSYHYYFTDGAIREINDSDLFAFSIGENKYFVSNGVYMINEPNISYNTTLWFSRGLIPSAGYCEQIKTYTVEETNKTIIENKKIFENKLSEYLAGSRKNKTAVKEAYNNYIESLEKEVNK